MINKKNLLGKTPHELGDKDAVHVAIVAVRAACLIEPGARCGLNEHREATPDAKGCGVADPFRKDSITTGQSFWLLLNQDEVPNVRHVWEHPKLDFTPPEREVKLNTTLADAAKNFGVTYDQLMDAIAYCVEHESPAQYPGTKTADEIAEFNEDCYDLWDEWASETGHEFYNAGTECCPELDTPDCELFAVGDDE